MCLAVAEHNTGCKLGLFLWRFLDAAMYAIAFATTLVAVHKLVVLHCWAVTEEQTQKHMNTRVRASGSAAKMRNESFASHQ